MNLGIGSLDLIESVAYPLPVTVIAQLLGVPSEDHERLKQWSDEVSLFLSGDVAAFAEGMALGEGLGISRKVLFDSLLGTPAVAPFIALKREKIERGNYEAEFPLRWMQKDMHLASVSAYESGVAMPVTNAAKELYRLAMMEGHAVQDFSAIYVYLASGGDFATNRGPVKNTPQAFQASPHSSGKGSRPDEPPRGRSAAEHQDSSNNYELVRKLLLV